MTAEDRLVVIETKIAFTEDLVHSLNDTVIAQQQRLEELEQRYQNLLDRMSALSPPTQDTIDEPPPHY